MWVNNVRGFGYYFLPGTDPADVSVPLAVEDVKGMKVANTLLAGPVNGKPFAEGRSFKEYDIEKPLGWNGKVPVNIKK